MRPGWMLDLDEDDTLPPGWMSDLVSNKYFEINLYANNDSLIQLSLDLTWLW